MKKFALIVLLAVALVLSLSVMVKAQDDDAAKEVKKPKPINVTITGLNYVLLDALAADKKEEAPEALKNMTALKVNEVLNEEGEVMEELKGKTLYYLPTAEAEILYTDETLLEVPVLIAGMLFKDQNAILVDTAEMDFSGADWLEMELGTKSQQQDVEEDNH